MFWAFKVTYGAHWHGVLLFVRVYRVGPVPNEGEGFGGYLQEVSPALQSGRWFQRLRSCSDASNQPVQRKATETKVYCVVEWWDIE